MLDVLLSAGVRAKVARLHQLIERHKEIIECFINLLSTPTKVPSLHRFVNVVIYVFFNGVAIDTSASAETISQLFDYDAFKTR